MAPVNRPPPTAAHARAAARHLGRRICVNLLFATLHASPPPSSEWHRCFCWLKGSAQAEFSRKTAEILGFSITPGPSSYTHTGGGVILAAGAGPGSGLPLPSRRLTARTAISWSQRIWQDSLTPLSPRASRRSFSASVFPDGSPSRNSTRHVVHRALPPHACKMSTFASCSIARTNRLSAGTSNTPNPSTVSLGIRYCMFS
jgi:hypothetical protein